VAYTIEYNNKSSSAAEKIDLLSLLRGFSQGDGVAEKKYLNNFDNLESLNHLLTLTLLKLVAENINLLGLRQGPLKGIDVVNMYWVLSFRSRQAHFSSLLRNKKKSNKKGDVGDKHYSIPFSLVDTANKRSKRIFDYLTKFWHDNSKSNIEIRSFLILF
jgi:hypothetical protein